MVMQKKKENIAIVSLLFAVLILDTFAAEDSNCTNDGLSSLSPKMPTHLFLHGQVASDNLQNAEIFCTGNKLIWGPVNSTFENGTFYLECSAENKSWIQPLLWPSEENCNDSTTTCNKDVFPSSAYLKRDALTDDPITGTKLSDYTCHDPFKALAYEFSVLCYNGTFFPNETFPAESEICVDPKSCPLPDIRNKWKTQVTDNGEYISTDIDLTKESMEHGSTMTVQCAQEVEKFVAEIDPEGQGSLTYKCQTGNIVDSKGSSSWDFPGVFQCQPVCTNRSITIPIESNFSNPDLIRVFDGDKLTLTCRDESHLVNSDWSNKFEINCKRDGSFDTVSSWPKCVAPPNCGLPPTPNNESGLVAVNEAVPILVPNKAMFYCSDTLNITENNQTEVVKYVTRLGNEIELPCENNTLDGDGFYNFTLPGGFKQGDVYEPIICRKPNYCNDTLTSWPLPPTDHGLQEKPTPSVGVPEFSYLTFNCSDANEVMYTPPLYIEKFSEDYEFKVQCSKGGVAMEKVTAWPKCDAKELPKCENFPAPPLNVPIDLAERTPVLPGASVFYKCTGFGQSSTLGENIEVKCVKNCQGSNCVSEGSLSFQKPEGWDKIKCSSLIYPDFREPNCFCLGDSTSNGNWALNEQQSKDTLDKVCSIDEREEAYVARMVPFKKRCGVKNKNVINLDNKCHCSESNNGGVDFSIWSVMELDNYVWHKNFSFPSTVNYKALKKEFEKELNHKLIDYYISGNSPWRFVRTKVLGFEPGNPKGCPFNVFPEPPAETELVLETKTSVPFGEYGYYLCSNETRSVTNDGVRFKVKCLPNGRFQNRKWLECRERGMCTKRPVIPRTDPPTGLNLSESRNVLEFDYANYTCADPSQVLSPPTEDNIFRVLCKRKDRKGRNNFDQSVKVNWPTCVGRPASACDLWSTSGSTLDKAPEGYELKEEIVSYVLDGSKVELVCEQEGFLAGEVPSIFYQCNNQTFSPQGFEHPPPQCRKPVECPMDLPMPPDESGIKAPQLLKPLKESEAVDYTCTKSGWSLYGNYLEEQDFVGWNTSSPLPSLSIVDGKLKLSCKKLTDTTANIETISAWPKCRNTEIKQCLVSSIAAQVGSKWPLTKLTTKFPDISSVNIGDHVTVVCIDSSEVNEAFKEKKLECKYDGTFEITEEFKACKAPENCSNKILPDDTKPWETQKLNLTGALEGIKQFDVVEFGCTDNKTLAGIQTTTGMSPGYIDDGKFKLPCQLKDDGNWTVPVEWPLCEDKKDACTTAIKDDESIDSNVRNTLDTNFMTSQAVPVNVSQKISYGCKTTGYVTALGEILDLTCTESGKFDLPNPIPSCREPVLCETAPIPPEESRLLNTTSTGVKEWENAIYNCKPGTNLTTTENFSLQCGSNGYYTKVPEFPVCNVIACVDIPTPKEHYGTSQTLVPINDVLNFTCADETDFTRIPDHDKLDPLQLTCNENGEFVPTATTPLVSANVSTWPVCRRHFECETPPTPPTLSGLSNSNSSGLKEFHDAKYYCMEGRALTDANFFSIKCGKVVAASGLFNVTGVVWPTCEITHCLLNQIGTGNSDGYNATTDTNPAVDESIKLKCASSGQITDLGTEIGPYQCNADGTFAIAASIKDESTTQCRDARDCTKPIPRVESNLQNTTSTSVKEFDKLKYYCNTGLKLDDGKDHQEVIMGTCLENGENSATITWETCTKACDFNIETPPNSSNLQVDSYTVIRPDSDVTYSCKSGYILNATLENDDGDTMTIDNGKLKLKCNSSAIFPSPVWPNCTEETSESSDSSDRKKRSSEKYGHLQDDIEYTILVMVETQFMWTDGIENEINITTNMTREDRKEFPSKMIEHFHTILETEALGPEDPETNIFNINSLKLKSQKIRPLCEQPINYNYEIINAVTRQAENENPLGISNCIPSQINPVCTNENIDAPWVTSLGFTYKKQGPSDTDLTWMNETIREHKVPLGGEIVFYCSDESKRKRPRKDDFDDNKDDGLLYGYCTYAGKFSIPMSPASWDRCRMKCPVDKPEPPERPNAQLKLNKKYDNWDQELWEGEKIYYTCENDTLVIDHTKGLKQKEYQCQISGYYDTPDSPDFPGLWPECTAPPVDPIIIEAVLLMTGKFDRNINYMQLLQKTDGQKPETVDANEALMGITIPSLIAILVIILICMCCTRPNSPICKIFEPKS